MSHLDALRLAVHWLSVAPYTRISEGVGEFGNFTAFYSYSQDTGLLDMSVKKKAGGQVVKENMEREVRLSFTGCGASWDVKGEQLTWTVKLPIAGDPFQEDVEEAAA